MLAAGLAETSSDLRVLDGSGRWAVVVTFEGEVVCARFDQWTAAPLPRAEHPWNGPRATDWTSSLDRDGYIAAVRDVRERIAAGTVYQVNVCRVLEAPLPDDADDLLPLANILGERHDAPFAGLVALPDLQVVSASPELFLRRDGDRVTSSPIKGTGRTAADLTAKDGAENVMIVDLVRNDLSRVCVTGSIAVDELLSVEKHPGLVHLVSTVSGRLRPGTGWRDLFEATFPPGSVSGAPKSTALRAIEELEPVPRGPYCGAVGWVDADTGEGELAVGIRTFWARDGVLRFGTGAGITWGSDPEREWAETELKAERLVGLASC
ncbi:chorismate-binding protein [Jiangella mangrovi]|uniref:Para-aminobenzoate synthetase component 1 n=1 Tax=Jiangella mangrovi TaxID=1524084 RepID=A0A7W9GVI7_9ACTN|nr:anthranilate synthase component I family protein [Jiangella mangrovi]MBB5790860.1 para-aminobenzoate synthetase component 1 [Jiangella mangrovi]